jgi:AAA+ superfamily predicted ATPase
LEVEEGKEGELKKYILLFDECDSLIANRDGMGMILRGQVNTLLSELEKFDGVCIFTTNSIKSLDPAMERRITEKIEFEFPNREQREKIWKRLIPKKAPISADVDFEKLSEIPIAGGNIKNCVLNSARESARLKQKEIKYQNFLNAIEKEVKGLKAFEAIYRNKYGNGSILQEIRTENIDGKVSRVLDKVAEEKAKSINK